jgi:hypothetical protein
LCTKDQILDLLSRWSIQRFEQIDCSAAFYSKLIRYQPLIVIHLIKNDLKEEKTNKEKLSSYFQHNSKVFEKKLPNFKQILLYIPSKPKKGNNFHTLRSVYKAMPVLYNQSCIVYH